ncbi:AAA family ATPase [Natronospira sp.]|uniref:AAA family ATPase n=1 Tax=Natronospira sp. TaxID=2024970 RepID=UPI0038735884
MLRSAYGELEARMAQPHSASEYTAAIWTLRLLVQTLPWPDGNFMSTRLGAEACQVLRFPREQELHVQGSLEVAQERLKAFEEEGCPEADTLMVNIDRLARHLKLSEVEEVILGFAVFGQVYEWFEDALDDAMKAGRINGMPDLLSICTGIDRRAVANALAPGNRLQRSGLIDAIHRRHARQMLLAPMPGIGPNLCVEGREPIDLFSEQIIRAARPRLALEDFRHVEHDVTLLRDYLASSGGRPGVNVLIHGPPGVGKTELARLLGQILECEVFEVAFEQGDGTALKPEQRFASFQLAQAILAGDEQALVVFDEIEDVFPGSSPMDLFSSRQGPGKAWVNRLLETNAVPTIWLSNRIRQLDPAYIRRFDVVLELAEPDRKQKARILKAHFDDLAVGEEWLKELAARRGLSPAVTERAAQVARAVAPNDPERARKVAERVLTGQMEALGRRFHGATKKTSAVAQRDQFEPRFLNTDPSPEQLVTLLQKGKGGRLLFHGPPGTGKSALGRYLAGRLGRPVMVRRASDLLDKYVGETEKNLADMFAEAHKRKAVLVLDEADSFLRSRINARAGWEVSQINEFLTQMEAFQGWFVATTNFLEALDSASLRRFDLKVGFDWLRPDQAQSLFRRTLGRRGPLPRAVVKRLKRLHTLAPGDFAIATRQNHLFGRELDDEALLDHLEKECAHKPETGRESGIGFLAAVG